MTRRVHIFLALALASCATPGMAEQPGPGPAADHAQTLELASLETLMAMTTPAVPVADAAWTSALARDRKTVYLTFDDGPRPHATENVLDILDDEGVRATFFLVGKKAVLHPDIVQEIVRRGHTIGNHTYTHMMPWGKNRKLYVEDALKNRKLLEDIAGVPVPLFRPPGGNLRMIGEIEKAGMKPVLWTTLSGDCAEGKAPAYLKSIISLQEERRPIFHYPMIVLMHDPSTRTAEALPKIIAYFKKNGYRFSADWDD
jgi:peptidoglycan/xylan/chitin deacetylase (PgdA/CDA1 family)